MRRRVEVYLYDHPELRARAVQWKAGLLAGLSRGYHWLRNGSRPLRVFLKRRLGINLTDAT